ncbi:MAG: DUF2141 domain-containing protein [Bacteroidota bacterium]
MKAIILLLSVLATGNLVAQNSLTVVVRNVKDAQGQVRVALFNNEKDFMKLRLDGKITEAQKGEVRIVFENVPQGEYAISVMHDENQNDKLDSNLVGIPKEGFGFSNDVMGMFGPPSFEKARFAFPVSEPVIINLKYL